MASRPRRSAAKRAQLAIADIAESSNTGMSTRHRRSDGRGATASISRGPPSSSPADGKDHLHLNVKVSSNKLRQATSGRSSVNSDRDPGGEIIAGKRNRGGRKNYVVDSDSDDEDGDAEGEDEDEDMADLGEEDADGEADEDMMDIDAEGEEEELGDEDADGEDDTDALPAPPAITVSKPAPTTKASAKASTKASAKPPAKPSAKAANLRSSDDDLSDLDSDEEIEDMDDTMQMDADGDDDAEGEEDAEGEDDDDIQLPAASATDAELDSDDMSHAETPNFAKMTKRQRARFEEEPQQYMKLSDEVQVKKHLTAEEQSMRRAEMARRRRNLSDKRNEEVKMETINKLLKKQAPKTNRKAGVHGDEWGEGSARGANPRFVRWISTKAGSRVGVPGDMLKGPVGAVFIPNGLPAGMMIEEVS